MTRKLINNQILETKIMALKMQIEIVSREFVKPSSLNPHNHPKIHNLSFFDQYVPRLYMPLLFFYTSKDRKTDSIQRSNLLKSFLSITLSHYYPLAGRIIDDSSLDCNDKGALFLEARSKCDLSEIMKNPSDETLRLLCPDSLFYKDSSESGPIVVQVTYFNCGGMSIVLCMCHRVMDMATMSSFVNDWASLAREPDMKIIGPEFNIGSLYPPLDNPLMKPVHLILREDLVSRRLVFHGSKISELKKMVAVRVPNPTRVEVVSALLHKSAINSASSGTLKSSVMTHAINLRSHVSPPLSSRNKGNMVSTFQVLSPGCKEASLGWFVEEFRRSKVQLLNSFVNTNNNEEVLQKLPKRLELLGESFEARPESYSCTSWSRNSFYGLDFGWGKPVWVGTVFFKIEGMMILIDTREGDGIEAFLSIEEKVMDVFEQDEQLLSFCSINPGIVDI